MIESEEIESVEGLETQAREVLRNYFDESQITFFGSYSFNSLRTTFQIESGNKHYQIEYRINDGDLTVDLEEQDRSYINEIWDEKLLETHLQE